MKKELKDNASIRLCNKGLLDLYNKSKSFNKELGEIVDFYDFIIKATEIPEFTDAEKVALGEVLLGAELTRSKVQGLYLDILDLGDEFLNQTERENLSEKLKDFTAAQVVKVLAVISGDCN